MYKAIRRYNSDVHVYEFNPYKQRIKNEKGVPGRFEPLSKIGDPEPGEKVACKINATFFGGKSEHDGPYIEDGNWYGTVSETYLGVVFAKDYKLKFKKITDVDTAAYWQGNSFWVLGGSFVLTENEEVSLYNTKPFPHWDEPHPRTAIGQKANGNIVLVVVDGRSTTNTGMAGLQLAETMLELRCINSINLDGGGSSEMIIEGDIKNKPSDGSERPIGAALVVYRPWLIALDDGHGIETAGKRTPKWPDGTYLKENEFNRAVVDMLDARLKKHGFDTLLVAPGDADISIEYRVKKANDAKADFYLSVHANGYGDGNWNDVGGIETYVVGFGGEAEKAARIIHKHLLKGTQLADRKVQTANFYVLKYTNMPAILFELAFMTNEKEAKLLTSEEYREECAEEVIAGLCEYAGVEYQAHIESPGIVEPEPGTDYRETLNNFLKDLKQLIEKYE